MAEKETVVLNISSDEESGWGNSVDACGGGCGGGGGGGQDDSDDDVMVVDEIIAKPKLKVTKSLVKSVNNVEVFDDDECVILDGDPDKSVQVKNDRGEGGDDSDELLVISEKGQVACRDYPHARHLCVKYPFSCTRHEWHCDLCHCYVCDSLAPCVYWRTRLHCHATDKEEFWKAQRRSSKINDQTPPVTPRLRLKKNDKTPPMTPGLPDASLSMGLRPPCQTPLLHSNPLLQNQLLLTKATPQLYSVPTNNGTRNIASHGRNQRRSRHYMRNKVEQLLVSRQLRSVPNKLISGDRRCNVGNAGTPFISPVPSERTGTNCNKSSRINYGNQFPRSHCRVAGLESCGGVTPVLNTYQDSSLVNVNGTSLMSNLSPQTNRFSRTANHTRQRQIFPQIYGSTVNTNSSGPQHQLSSQIDTGFKFTNPMPTQPWVATHPNWDCPFDSSFPFQAQATPSSNGAKISQDPIHSEPLVNLGNFSNHCESGIPSQPNALQQGNGTQSTLRSNSTDFAFSGDYPAGHSNQTHPVRYNQL
ncbi:hypothetical protein ACH5RR_010499 [Cinchona calisaya]|uniref:Uncharacterized protein n=1 Tax=Cinchona calisaya TaxID=153742 RepID=A0ABD3AJ39_9GENT